MDDLLTTKRRADPRELLEKIKAKYPTDKARRIFHAAVTEDPRYLRVVIEHAFNEWIAPEEDR